MMGGVRFFFLTGGQNIWSEITQGRAEVILLH